MGTHFLMPGEVWHGSRSQVTTVLGSCVSVTFWRPRSAKGGVCHFVLPSRTRSVSEPLDGRYGEEALELLRQRLDLYRVPPSEWEVAIYGGGTLMNDGGTAVRSVGEQNVALARSWLARNGFAIRQEDVGRRVHRRLRFDTVTGEVRLTVQPLVAVG